MSIAVRDECCLVECVGTQRVGSGQIYCHQPILTKNMSSSQRLHYVDTEYITPVHVLDAVAVDTNLPIPYFRVDIL